MSPKKVYFQAKNPYNWYSLKKNLYSLFILATLHFIYLEPARAIFKKTKLNETEKEEKEIIGDRKEKSKEIDICKQKRNKC